jgi:uroporphyrinogen decarboxylase
MNKREVVKLVLDGKKPPYVPWSYNFTLEAQEKLEEHFGTADLEPLFDNHLAGFGNGIGFFTDIGDEQVRDVFGVVWDRSVDKDIGIVRGQVFPEPTLKNFCFPNPRDPLFYQGMKEGVVQFADRFRIFNIGFSLYERAWTMRGMAEMLMDFHDNPKFAHDLLNTIADYNIEQVHEAIKYDIDAVYFGDDWGSQHGLIMGYPLWKKFIFPVLKRMYAEVKKAGKYVFIHSCGDVDELFDDLISIGLDCFNPFQPEVMDVFALMEKYRGRLSFHGGLSTQRTLPYGSVEDVRAATLKLLAAGREGGYIFSPAHSVEGDVPVENMLAFMQILKEQNGYS